MDIKPLKTDANYRAALKEIENRMMAATDTPEVEKLNFMVTLIEAYKAKHFPLTRMGPGMYCLGTNQSSGQCRIESIYYEFKTSAFLATIKQSNKAPIFELINKLSPRESLEK
jgi:antitoxin component HigA of HigAB toxin-antitoxin module